MNRLTAIGLASLVAYGALIAAKYTGVVSAAREESVAPVAAQQAEQGRVEVAPPRAEPLQAVRSSRGIAALMATCSSRLTPNA